MSFNTFTPPRSDNCFRLLPTIKHGIRFNNRMGRSSNRIPPINDIKLLTLPNLQRRYLRFRRRRDDELLALSSRHAFPLPPTRIGSLFLISSLRIHRPRTIDGACGDAAGADGLEIGFGARGGAVAVEGAQVEEPSHERPAHWHVGYVDCGAGFADVPECPHRGERGDEGVVFVQDGAEDLEGGELLFVFLCGM